jgi:hypothetical protein
MSKKYEYQYWSHNASGETFAVELTNGVVTGVCGPLHYTDRPDDMRDFEYHDDDTDQDAAEIQAHREDYTLDETNQKRRYSLRLRLTDRERDELKNEANIRGQTLSEYARRMLFPTPR